METFVVDNDNCMYAVGKDQNGEYKLLELKQRANNAKLPEVEIVDLKEEMKAKNRSMFSRNLQKEIQERCTELQYQKWVYENMQSVATNIHVAEQKFFLINAKQLLKTNKITTEANKLAKSTLTMPGFPLK